MAAPAAAIASAKPAVMIDHCATTELVWPAASCAYTGDTKPRTRNPNSRDRTDRRVLTENASIPRASNRELRVESVAQARVRGSSAPPRFGAARHPKRGSPRQHPHRVDVQTRHHNVGGESEHSIPCEKLH